MAIQLSLPSVVVLVPLIAVTAGCGANVVPSVDGDSSVAPVDDSAKVDVPAEALVLTDALVVTCSACMAANCAAESKACEGDTGCGKRIDCLDACIKVPKPDECQTKCVADIPTATGDAYFKCAVTKCKDACKVGTG